MPEITFLYAGLLAILFAVLSTMAAMQRGQTQVLLGDGGNAGLRMALRRFGNLSEYGAMAIIVLMLLELSGAAPLWLHAYGLSLIAFRLLHPLVLFDDPAAPFWRKTGRFVAAAGTALLLLVGGLALAWMSLT